MYIICTFKRKIPCLCLRFPNIYKVEIYHGCTNDEKLLRLLSKSFKENVTIIFRRITFTASMLIIWEIKSTNCITTLEGSLLPSPLQPVFNF